MKRFEPRPSPWQGDALPLSYIRRLTLGQCPRDWLSMQHGGSVGQGGGGNGMEGSESAMESGRGKGRGFMRKSQANRGMEGGEGGKQRCREKRSTVWTQKPIK